MLNFEPVDECICYLRLNGKFFNITIFCVHDRTEDNYYMVKSSYNDRKDRVYQTIPKHDAVTVTGDTNARVSKDPLNPAPVNKVSMKYRMTREKYYVIL